MKKLFSAIARAFRAMSTAVTTSWRYCRDTGKWISETVASIGGGIGGGGGDAGFGTAEDLVPDEIAPAAAAIEPSTNLKNVRALAAAISNGCATEELCSRVDERTFNWLSQLDRSMIAKVLLSSDEALRGHLRGRSTIRGVVQADEASVNAYRETWMMEVQQSAEQGRELQMSPI